MTYEDTLYNNNDDIYMDTDADPVDDGEETDDGTVEKPIEGDEEDL